MRQGFTILYGRSNVVSFNSGTFGRYTKDEDGTIEVPEAAVSEAESHGFFRTYAEAHAKPKKKLEDLYNERQRQLNTLAADESTAAGPDLSPPKKARKITPEERVAISTRFDLREYCDGNDIEIPAKTNNEGLRSLVLEHMKAEAASLEAGGTSS